MLNDKKPKSLEETDPRYLAQSTKCEVFENETDTPACPDPYPERGLPVSGPSPKPKPLPQPEDFKLVLPYEINVTSAKGTFSHKIETAHDKDILMQYLLPMNRMIPPVEHV